MPEQQDVDQQQLTDEKHGDVVALPAQSADEKAFCERELATDYLLRVYQICQEELYLTARLRAMYSQLPMLIEDLDKRRRNLVELADETMAKLKERPISDAM